MPFRLLCRGCQHALIVPPTLIDKTISCPRCGQHQLVHPADLKETEATVGQPATSLPEERKVRVSASEASNRPAAEGGVPSKSAVTPAQPSPARQQTPSGGTSPGVVAPGSSKQPPPTPAGQAQPAAWAPPVYSRPAPEKEEEAEAQWVNPWGLTSLTLAGAGLLLASLVGLRFLTLGLAGLGLAVTIVGFVATRQERETKDLVWLGLGGGLSALVLGLVQFAPGWLNHHWALIGEVTRTDPNHLVRVPRDKMQQEGKPLTAADWVDGASEAIRQDDMIFRVEAVQSGELPDLGTGTFLQVHCRLINSGQALPIAFGGFSNEKNKPVLSDENGRSYPFLGQRLRKVNSRGSADYEKSDVRTSELPPSGGRQDLLLIFQDPPAGISQFKLEVPASAWGRKGVCRLLIPREM